MTFRPFASKLARTKFGKKALEQPDDPAFLKRKPTPRVWTGLVCIALGYISVLPGLAFLSWLAVETEKALYIAVGGPVYYILTHIIFYIGLYLAGKGYIKEAVLWVAKKFILWALTPSIHPETP